jgi:fatty-acid peroxygenase
MSKIPSDPNPDSTLALLSQGYTYISTRCERYGSDLFKTRLMLSPAICMLGEEAARIFYEPDRFTRQRAMPPTALMLLQDKGSVQLLDGERHRPRKRMFMSLMTPASIQALVDRAADEWRSQFRNSQRMDEVAILPQAQEVIFRAVSQWAGIPLTDSDARRWTGAFAAMVDGAGSIGPRNWRGLLLRARAERWVRSIVQDVRDGKRDSPEGSALHAVCFFRGPDGEALDTKVAAVELINVLRPTVAVAWYVTFAALALHRYPDCKRTLENGDEGDLERFVQEVRRFYPMFPAVGGRVRKPFDWRGHHFTEGTWVILDLYGTNHDPRIWTDPGEFRPGRFRDWNGSPFNFIPQGAGGFENGHRCPGERITIELLKSAVRLLAAEVHYDVPDQDLSIDLSRMPARPKSGFVIRNARPAAVRISPELADRGAERRSLSG